jgi:hypothetical protein
VKKKPPYKAHIKGVEWTFFVQTPATYRRSHGADGKDSEAITYPYDREVYFNSNYLSPYTVKHEILHVFVASSSTDSSSLDADQKEELCCELYGNHSTDMESLAEKILNYFLR